MRFAPRASNCSTNARPSPRFAPVTTATEPSILMAVPFQEMPVVLCRRGRPNKTDSSVYWLPKKREGLHALLSTHQFQGRVAGHVGGARVALDHGRYDGPFDQNAHGGRDLRSRRADRLLDQPAQELAEALLVPADELGAGVGGISQFDGGVLEGTAPEPRRLEKVLQGCKEGPQGALRLLAVPLHRR